MTRAEAITFIQMIIDESGTEVYSPADIGSALDEAQVSVIRDEWQKGRKESLRKLALTESYGSASAATTQEILYVESVMLRAGLTGAFKLKAEYIPPHQHDYAFSSAGISKRHEYSVEGGLVTTNGAAFMVSYYRQPSGSPADAPLYLHGRICTEAAALLSRRDHPDERPTLGAIYDFDELTGAQQQGRGGSSIATRNA